MLYIQRETPKVCVVQYLEFTTLTENNLLTTGAVF